MGGVTNKIRVAVADDHSLLRQALAKLINSFENFVVLFEANNGNEIKARLTKHIIPDIVLLDVNMPDMDGYETAQWLHQNYPQIKVLALSMFSDENIIIRMLKLGAKGYILKNAEPEELKEALTSVLEKDFYLSEYISGKIVSGLNKDLDRPDDRVSLTEKEKELLKWICTEMTYKDIAAKMFVSPRTLDDYRNNLFEKLKVRTRVGLVLYAIRNRIVEI
jgi:two-component system, NarL family, invasion response regulator UvrY